MSNYKPSKYGKQTVVNKGDGFVQVNTFNGNAWLCIDVRASHDLIAGAKRAGLTKISDYRYVIMNRLIGPTCTHSVHTTLESAELALSRMDPLTRDEWHVIDMKSDEYNDLFED